MWICFHKLFLFVVFMFCDLILLVFHKFDPMFIGMLASIARIQKQQFP